MDGPITLDPEILIKHLTAQRNAALDEAARLASALEQILAGRESTSATDAERAPVEENGNFR